MSQAVAGECLVGVGRVFAPGLVLGAEVGSEVVAAEVEEGAEDISVGEGDFGGDGAEAFEPGPAEEFHEDGFGLIVEGVCGEDVGGVARDQQGSEDLVAEVSGGFLDGFVVGGGTGGGVDRVNAEGDFKAVAEVSDKGLVGVGFGCAEGVVDVDGGEADSESVAGEGVGGVEQEEERGGVGSAGDGAADAVAGAEGGNG